MTSGTRPSPLCREHFIPLNRQLAAGLEAAIRDGHIPDRAALPSTRDLARQLAVDRSTVGAAYARLRRRGWISGASGRRALAKSGIGREDAAGHGEVPGGCEEVAGAAIQGALAQAFRLGLSRSAMARKIAAALPGSTSPRPALFEPRHGLRRVIAAEIEVRAGVAVCPYGRLHALPARQPVFVRREVLAALRARGPVPLGREWLPLDLHGGTREQGLVRRGLRSGVVVLLSVSAAVRRYASELAAREFSRGISFLALDPSQTGDVQRASTVARIVLFDAASRPIHPVAARLEPLALLRARQIQAIRVYVGGRSGRCGT